MRLIRSILFASIVMILFIEPVRGLDITIDYSDGTNEGFNDLVLGPQRNAAFEHALTIWTEKLDGTIPIRVRAEFDTVAEGVGFVTAAGTINIQPGTTAETITIDKAVTIVNVGTGARGLPETIVRIGDQSAADPLLPNRKSLDQSTTGFVSETPR